MIKNYLKTALRIMLRQKGYSFINIAGLSVGIAATLIIITYIVDERSYDTMHADAARIYRIACSGRLQGTAMEIATSPAPVAEAIQKGIPQIQEAVRVGVFRTMPMGYEEKHFTEQNVAVADSNFFQFFSFAVVKGNPETFLKGTNKIVITESTAKKYFGNEDPIGKIMVRGSEKTASEVTGVVKDTPAKKPRAR
jgi:putative ABC transport system permease protein